MASLSTCHLGLWLGWQILLNLVKIASLFQNIIAKPTFLYAGTEGGHCQGACHPQWFFYVTRNTQSLMLRDRFLHQTYPCPVRDLNSELCHPSGCANHYTTAPLSMCLKKAWERKVILSPKTEIFGRRIRKPSN